MLRNNKKAIPHDIALTGTFDGKVITLTAEEGVEPTTIKINSTQVELLADYEDKEIVIGVRPEKIALKGSTDLNKDANYFDIVCNFRELWAMSLWSIPLSLVKKYLL